MFNQGSKLAVLESKVNIYENLSKEMLSKLESAVDKISEGNSRIAAILAKHDERIEQSIKTDEILIKMVEDLKTENKQDHREVISRIEILEKIVEELKKFRWQVGGIIAFVVFGIGIINAFVPGLLTPERQEIIIQKVK